MMAVLVLAGDQRTASVPQLLPVALDNKRCCSHLGEPSRISNLSCCTSSKEESVMAIAPKSLAATTRTDVSPSPLARLTGPLAILAGVLYTGAQLVMLARIGLLDLTNPQFRQVLFADPVYLISGVVYFVAFCLLMLALVAIDGRNGHTAGTFWAVGLCAAVIDTLASAGNVGWADVFAMPWVVEVAPEAVKVRPTSGMYAYGAVASYLLFTLGWVLFGLASLRARVFPLVICLAMVVGGIIGYIASPPFGIPFGLAITGLGVSMIWSKTSAGEIAAAAQLAK
jgi:hypothetical protein